MATSNSASVGLPTEAVLEIAIGNDYGTVGKSYHRNTTVLVMLADEETLRYGNNGDNVDFAATVLEPAPFFHSSSSPKTIASWTPITLTAATSTVTRQIRVYSDGVFDLFHGGHAQQFRQVKTAFSNVHLIIGVCADDDVQLYKGTRPVMNVDERCDTVRHCRYVDEVIRNPPFYYTVEFIDSIKVDIVTHDAIPYGTPSGDDLAR